MPETNSRKLRVIGAGWLGLGVLFSAIGFIALVSVVLGDDPATAAFEAGYAWQ